MNRTPLRLSYILRYIFRKIEIMSWSESKYEFNKSSTTTDWQIQIATEKQYMKGSK